MRWELRGPKFSGNKIMGNIKWRINAWAINEEGVIIQSGTLPTLLFIEMQRHDHGPQESLINHTAPLHVFLVTCVGGPSVSILMVMWMSFSVAFHFFVRYMYRYSGWLPSGIISWINRTVMDTSVFLKCINHIYNGEYEDLPCKELRMHGRAVSCNQIIFLVYLCIQRKLGRHLLDHKKYPFYQNCNLLVRFTNLHVNYKL